MLALASLSGCAAIAITNMTPSSLPENPSGIYTFTLRVSPKTASVIPDSITPTIVVGEASHPMVRSPASTEIFEYDYKLPAFHNEIGYYYLVSYNTGGNLTTSAHQDSSALLHTAIVSRYVLALEVNRGPVGAKIGILGRGFTPQDLVGFDGTPVRTVYESPTSLGFFVPAFSPGRNYKVTISGATGNSSVGSFRIDSSDVTVEPASLTPWPPARSRSLTFTIANPAPAGGLSSSTRDDGRPRQPSDHARGGRARGPGHGHRDGRGRQARLGQPFPQGIRHRRDDDTRHGPGRQVAAPEQFPKIV